ncbi:cyclophilin-like fold protein [Mucilaginibacter phyllosphaerae]|uniref:Cyclophilin-like domain-containing protein n=1 Tax=Mucilaginibacter phyllosphaerae TaxID=1812349 RepID=A0A4Y8AFB7_9SPHI|nr:cyclophilin-like fold protein [Mucilaginibacter phyllosphaerae]MBB3968925.1 hypothetical protein [Mucilaginibacter phyllosphaerae]TEW67450.1 hypothetical protein E2R65_05530 [Mucilaginibacter phyllosphaerae]GGH23506.1 hypothetical protein GCM10007352_37430 [Mucilaginibacter phyllosphaerae]
MKHINRTYLLLLLLLTALAVSSFSCSKGNDDGAGTTPDATNPNTSLKMKITINSKVFTATLANNATGRAFAQLLPLTIQMKDLNANEKFFDLASSLPTQSSNPGNINNGDIMLYGSRTLVLFYKGFQTSFAYTKIGAVNDTDGYATALGNGNVTVTFETE